MTVPIEARETIRIALADAADYRRNHAAAADLLLIARYESVGDHLERGSLILLGAEAASHVAYDGTLHLAVSDLTVFAAALADGAAWREYRAAAWCPDCAASAAEVCAEHGRDLQLATAYRALAVSLAGPR